MRKISLPLGFDPWTVQLVASRYTDYAILVIIIIIIVIIIIIIIELIPVCFPAKNYRKFSAEESVFS